jgi:RNA 2',3'-cyclic 3'-phosphodiesterase
VNDGRARLFVALELPGVVREVLVRWRSEVLHDPLGLRLIAPDQLHVTLCFLGWRGVGEIDEIRSACGILAGEPVAELRLSDPIWLPRRRPRVLAVKLHDPERALANAQASLSRALQEGGWYTPESRPFSPHVTVARVATGARVRPYALAPPPALALRGSEAVLYQSLLGPGGARYEPLATIELGQIGGPADPLSVVRRFHAAQARAYAGQGAQGLSTLLAADVVWHVPGRSHIAGEHRGRRAVLAYLDKRRQLTDATFRVTVHGMAIIGERVVQLAGGRATRGGEELSWETVGLFRVRDGRIAECWLIPFDQFEFDRIWS